MSPLEIKAELIRSGTSQTELAKKLGVTPAFVNQVISGVRHTDRVRRLIAKAIKKPTAEVWPSEKKAA